MRKTRSPHAAKWLCQKKDSRPLFWCPVQEQNGGVVTANMLTSFGIDEFLTRTDGSGTRALLTDGLGSPIALEDGTGTVPTQYTYEPFGYTTQAGQASTNSYKYTGREDDGTGLYFYRARYYSPRLQRFIAEDRIGFKGGDPNLYAYVLNRPLGLTDPLGLWTPKFHHDMTRDSALSCGMSDADATALAEANMDQDFSFWGLPSGSTLNPWSAKHGMPGTDWVSYSGAQFAIAQQNNDLNALGQGLHALQDAFSHDYADAGMWDHILSWFGGHDPDDPTANVAAADLATAATQSAIRDFMSSRGDKPKCN